MVIGIRQFIPYPVFYIKGINGSVNYHGLNWFSSFEWIFCIQLFYLCSLIPKFIYSLYFIVYVYKQFVSNDRRHVLNSTYGNMDKKIQLLVNSLI